MAPELRTSDEPTEEQIQLARNQGDAFQAALEHVTRQEAHGDEREVGDYRVGYAVEKAEGMYAWTDGTLEWQSPGDANCHIEVSVRSALDGRFLPGLKVRATLLDENGNEVGTHEQPFLWHPWLYHYGRNWTVPGEGRYALRIRVEPPRYARHDRKNGNRFTEPVDVTFEGVEIQTGQK